MYFFTLIRSGVLIRGYRDPGFHADAYLTWEKRLAQENSPFLGGEIPDANDLLLFGIVQCHCSIPVPTVLELQTDTRLSFTRKWIGRMQSRFANYESLYSATYFPPTLQVQSEQPVRSSLHFGWGASFGSFAFPSPFLQSGIL